MPLYCLFFQPLKTSPAFTSSSMSGASESATMSALRPALTARACSPEAPYDCENETSLPAAVFWNIGISCAYASRGVEYATSLSSVSFARAGAEGATTAAPAIAEARAADGDEHELVGDACQSLPSLEYCLQRL